MMVRYAQDSGKINFFREIFAIMTSLRVFGFKNRNFAGFSSGIEILIFDCGGQGCRIISVFDGSCANMPFTKQLESLLQNSSEFAGRYKSPAR
jgi:hypothetical protein